jgi:hypothetical protein
VETNINIADLVQPKFKVGQDVWVVQRSYSGRIEHLMARRIHAIDFAVEIKNDRDGREVRSTKLVYRGTNSREWGEELLYASLNDIPDVDRKAIV